MNGRRGHVHFFRRLPETQGRRRRAYWTAFALKKQEKFAEADRQLERLIRERPNSNWLDDARAMRVEIAGQTGNRQVVERELDKNDLEIKAIALQSISIQPGPRGRLRRRHPRRAPRRTGG